MMGRALENLVRTEIEGKKIKIETDAIRLRDEFAMAALPLCSGAMFALEGPEPPPTGELLRARAAYRLADAMMEARK